jgi:lipopolysaccharide export system protein LptA
LALSLKSVDGRFALDGVGWSWTPARSVLVVSNQVSATVRRAALSGGATNRPAEPPIRITSERLVYSGSRAVFSGQVRAKDGTQTLECGELTVDLADAGGVREIQARQAVHLVQPGVEVWSELASYQLATNLLRISEGARWKLGEREGSARTLTLNRAAGSTKAEGDVFMRFPTTNLVAASTNSVAASTNAAAARRDAIEVRAEMFEHAERGGTNAVAIYKNHVRVVHPTGQLACEKLTVEFEPDGRGLARLIAEEKVEIVSQKNRARGAKAVYELAQSKATLTGEPQWELEGLQGRSDLVVLHPNDEEIFALGNVELVTKPGAANRWDGFGLNTAKAGAGDTNAPVHIFARSLAHGARVSVFSEDVRLVDSRGEMRTPLLTVYHGASNRIDRAVAERGVRLQQGTDVAIGQRATYTVADGLVELTGDAALTRTNGTVHAERFVLNRLRNTFGMRGNFQIRMPAEKKP